MVVARGQKVALKNFVEGSFTLRWTSFEDFDLIAVYEGSTRGVVYFSDVGSSVKDPYLELQDDVDLASTDKDNEQRIVISRMNVEKIWLFAWSFECMSEDTSLDFEASGLHLEIQSAAGSWTTKPTDLATGNLCRLGLVYRGDDGQVWFENRSEVFNDSAFQDIEELFVYLS